MVGFEPTTTRFQGEDSGQAELHTDELHKNPRSLEVWGIWLNFLEGNAKTR